jgi:hypothetical protein
LPCASKADQGAGGTKNNEKDHSRTEVVGADLVCLVTAHENADLAGLFVLQDFSLTGSSLLPFIVALIEAVKLGTPVEWTVFLSWGSFE